MNKEAHVAYYGNIAIERRYCEDCKGFAFVIDGEIRCCGQKVNEPLPTKRKRMSDVPWKRKGPPKKEKDRILREQDESCFWCERRFGKIVWLGRKRIALRIEWDHLIAFTYSLDN
jgi:hypothetical protein